MMIKWRHQYDGDADRLARESCDVRCRDESKTLQGPAQDADLNVIVARFGIRDVPVVPVDPSLYGDVSDLPDLRAVLEYQRAGVEAFMGLPARVRSRFSNEPVELFEFLQDPENRSEAIRLGLIEKGPPKAAPVEASSVGAVVVPPGGPGSIPAVAGGPPAPPVAA